MDDLQHSTGSFKRLQGFRDVFSTLERSCSRGARMAVCPLCPEGRARGGCTRGRPCARAREGMVRYLDITQVDKLSAGIRLEGTPRDSAPLATPAGDTVAVFVELDGRPISFASVVQHVRALTTDSGPAAQLTLEAPKTLDVWERREYVRVAVPSTAMAHCSLHAPGLQPVSCQLRDLSFSGVGLSVDHLPDLYTEAQVTLEIRLNPEGAGGLEGRFSARLVRMSQLHHRGERLLGLSWLHLTGRQDRQLSLMIRHLERAQLVRRRQLS
ncbi:flagellar brake protein [Ectothiorhodospira variabilis]|uniref:flagellar brake protein n=1 Tax=Ectothiorhodospira variabilis TaxID=505694 RepID=UPI001EFA8731|nr:PilZ domain-containing protein [Ectothiorhodospira variabilis]MCG5498544.1 PilZ domain-containing protein [Ectothiorhodospira variabilis]